MQFGANDVPEPHSPSWRKFLGKLWGPIPWLLELAALLQLMLHEYLEAAVIAGLLIFNAALALFQEDRAQAAMDALRSRLALLATVRRDGRWRSVPASTLVAGDVVKLTLGSIVPADVRVANGEALVDQSMLTGESLPAEVSAGSPTYAGALVRRGEAVAEVTATGTRTRFGRTAELVRLARGASSQQSAVLRVVRNLAFFSASMVAVQLIFALENGLPVTELLPLVLTGVLAAVPVALPATFTLAAAVGARWLTSRGALPTRLSAIDEAGTMDVLCSDKTGTLTENALAVATVVPASGLEVARVLSLAALASAEDPLDPVDAAVRAAAAPVAQNLGSRVRFVPFDPAQKMSQAELIAASGEHLHIVKGAFASIAARIPAPEAIATAASGLQASGQRVLGVAAGPTNALEWVGLIALTDPPRRDARALIDELRSLGVHVVMVTGDAAPTATVIARAVGLHGRACASSSVPERLQPDEFDVYAGVFPEDKFHIVRALQKTGHIVGMCGDGANDAPALRQSQMGIAVSTATDIAKSAAGIVLIQPGLAGIVAAVQCGRMTYQRILTYTLRSITAKITQMLFLTLGLLLTGQAILTPMLMVILLISGDFLAISATTDHVSPSREPNAWRIGHITLTGVVLGLCSMLFCIAVILYAQHVLGLAAHQGLRTLAAVTLVFSTQAAFYVVRDRRHLWSSRPSAWVMASSLVDVCLISVMAARGILMHALPWRLILVTLLCAALFAFFLDLIKSLLLSRLALAAAPAVP